MKNFVILINKIDNTRDFIKNSTVKRKKGKKQMSHLNKPLEPKILPIKSISKLPITFQRI